MKGWCAEQMQVLLTLFRLPVQWTRFLMARVATVLLHFILVMGVRPRGVALREEVRLQGDHPRGCK